MQTSPISTLALARSVHLPIRTMRLGLTLLLIAAADFLFVDRTIGVSLSVFLGLLALAALCGNRLQGTRDEVRVATASLVAGLIPTVEAAGLLPAFFGVAGLSLFTLGMTGRLDVPWPSALRRATVVMTMNACGLLRRFSRRRRSQKSVSRALFSAVGVWLVPAAVGAVFAVLFSIANPVFYSWIRFLDPRWLLLDLQPVRYAFWLFILLFAAPFVRVPAFRRPRTSAPRTMPGSASSLMSEGIVLRILVVVNVIFALQTGLDLAHLWGGAELPQGVSPAQNAQRAAYILVVSALLSATLVLLAAPERRMHKTRNARAVRILVHLWIVQNVVLVLSAILRLKLYIEIYALTELRIAAFIWMGLVVAGLLLIECRIAFGKTGGWLLKTNLIALGLALYGCALVDLRALAANYNVDHSLDVTGTGAPLDRDYLCSLGPSALPAIEGFIRLQDARAASASEPRLRDCVASFRLTLAGNSQDWRAWSFRDHRLRRSMQQGSNISVERGRETDDPGGG